MERCRSHAPALSVDKLPPAIELGSAENGVDKVVDTGWFERAGSHQTPEENRPQTARVLPTQAQRGLENRLY